MFALTNKPDMGARLYAGLIDQATDPRRGLDSMVMIQLIAGVLVETCLVFDEPDEALQGSFAKLGALLETRPYDGPLWKGALPPAHIMDYETERGRAAARLFFEEWLDCAFEFHELFLAVIHHMFIAWEVEGQKRDESYRLLIECALACMAFEISAQELCDIAIEQKAGLEGWSLGDCIASLSALAGRRLALSLSADSCELFRGPNLPENLDKIVHVLTQEAVRLGVPAGSDWRFGLAANDVPVNAPISLIHGMDPCCQDFFSMINLADQYMQSVACAKAAGRILAVAAGGELPEIEPIIAKPLAMAAITETYKSVCIESVFISV